MGSWGQGKQVGIRKAIWDHERTLKRAAGILERECGQKHELGEREDLCPTCQDAKQRRLEDEKRRERET